MSETTNNTSRPLSPHLQVYRLPMTAWMSITHRLTGAALVAGLLLVSAFFVAAAMGVEYYDKVAALAATVPGTVVLFGWSLALYYHLCNGVRHLVWDTGRLFDKKAATVSGWVVLLIAAALAAGTWYLASL